MTAPGPGLTSSRENSMASIEKRIRDVARAVA